jgi:magnesium-transporting ATPase (P-type)
LHLHILISFSSPGKELRGCFSHSLIARLSSQSTECSKFILAAQKMNSAGPKEKVQPNGRGNLPLPEPAHTLSAEEAVNALQANAEDGLSTEEAQARLEKYGRNELGGVEGVQVGKILMRQLSNAMVLVRWTIFNRQQSI